MRNISRFITLKIQDSLDLFQLTTPATLHVSTLRRLAYGTVLFLNRMGSVGLSFFTKFTKTQG